MRLAFFGGIYSNYLALEAAVLDARSRGADALFCLGDLGAFGPHPDCVFPLLREANITCIQGNYDESIGNDLDDCQCGYTDPRDNYFAQISYEYTYENTSPENRRWMRGLSKEHRLKIDDVKLLLCHGSPRQSNEFLWESTTSTHFLDKLAADHEADVILGTHTGIHWQRELKNDKRFVNVGVLGRPENDGKTNVWYTMLCTGSDAGQRLDHTNSLGNFDIEFIPIEYDHHRLARRMKEEKLPQEFVETTLTGWWTTCLEVLPGKERRKGKF